MALPTTNLTSHFDASGAGKLFRNYSNDGNHTTAPADGETVEVWEDEADGSVTDSIFAQDGDGPAYRSATPLMKVPCLDFNGSSDSFPALTQAGGSTKLLSEYFTASAMSVAVAFYPESITSTSANPYDNHIILGAPQGAAYFGISLRDVSGAKKIRAWNYDGGFDVTTDLAIATDRTYIAIYTHGGGNLTLRVIDDTGAEVSDTVASGDTGSLSVQFNVSPSGGLYNGRIGELALYNAESTGTDLTDLKNYFKDKWMTIAGAAGQPTMKRFGGVPYAGTTRQPRGQRGGVWGRSREGLLIPHHLIDRKAA